MQQTQCSKFFVSPELAPVAKAVQSQLPGVTLQAVEEFDHWLDNYTKHFPFDKPLEKAQWDPILVLHSSGSTGKSFPYHQIYASTLTLWQARLSQSLSTTDTLHLLTDI